MSFDKGTPPPLTSRFSAYITPGRVKQQAWDIENKRPNAGANPPGKKTVTAGSFKNERNLTVVEGAPDNMVLESGKHRAARAQNGFPAILKNLVLRPGNNGQAVNNGKAVNNTQERLSSRFSFSFFRSSARSDDSARGSLNSVATRDTVRVSAHPPADIDYDLDEKEQLQVNRNWNKEHNGFDDAFGSSPHLPTKDAARRIAGPTLQDRERDNRRFPTVRSVWRGILGIFSRIAERVSRRHADVDVNLTASDAKHVGHLSLNMTQGGNQLSNIQQSDDRSDAASVRTTITADSLVGEFRVQ